MCAEVCAGVCVRAGERENVCVCIYVSVYNGERVCVCVERFSKPIITNVRVYVCDVYDAYCVRRVCTKVLPTQGHRHHLPRCNGLKRKALNGAAE